MEQLKLMTLPRRQLRAEIQKPILCLCAAGAGLLLSGGRILGIHIPFAVCLTAALGATLPGLSTFLGALAGCLLWGADFTLVTLTAAFLSLVLHWAVQEMPLADKPWFPALSALFPGFVVEVLCLLAAPVTWRSILTFLVVLAVLPAGTTAALQLLRKPKGPMLCAALFALCSGCGACTVWEIPLGALPAAGIVFSLSGTSLGLPAAILAGLALDWSWAGDVSCTAVLAAAALAAEALQRKKRHWRMLGFLLAAAGTAVLGGGGGTLLLAMIPGTLAAWLLPRLQVESDLETPLEALRSRLWEAGRAMNAVYCQLDDVPAVNRHLEISEIYDKATSRVCATCGSFSRCWRKEAARTRQYLLDAAPAVFTRREGKEEDFSEEFRANCRHFPQLLNSLNTVLEQDSQRRQRENFRRELRTVLAGQYRILSDYLRAGVLPPRSARPPRFTADTGFAVKSRDQHACGDRCAAFRTGNRQYLLLFDGMGTGEAAARCSGQACELLTGLLLSGMEPDDALETLGALSILRDSGSFSTVDLAFVSLTTGEGALYKWGGGDSYLILDGKIKKIGTASLPPGLGVGGTQVAQRTGLSLSRGEVLILTSDGVDGEDVRRQSAVAESLQAKNVAEAIVERTGKGEDDRSAGVLKLRPSSAQ